MAQHSTAMETSTERPSSRSPTRPTSTPFDLSASIKAKALAIVASPLQAQSNDVGSQLSFWNGLGTKMGSNQDRPKKAQ